MQLALILGQTPRIVCFSTLYGSKWVATPHTLAGLLRTFGFSTLYGSKWVATKQIHTTYAALLRFSTLYGSKWVATLVEHGVQHNLGGVSVPSTGRSGLQRQMLLLLRRSQRVSVPSTGRSGLQLSSCLSPRYAYSVSVPSTGRSGLQQREPRLNAAPSPGFSTLYGSKWVATFYILYSVWACGKFQYPLRVEVGCNVEDRLVAWDTTVVSVPSTGRSGLQRSIF